MACYTGKGLQRQLYRQARRNPREVVTLSNPGYLALQKQRRDLKQKLEARSQGEDMPRIRTPAEILEPQHTPRFDLNRCFVYEDFECVVYSKSDNANWAGRVFLSDDDGLYVRCRNGRMMVQPDEAGYVESRKRRAIDVLEQAVRYVVV